MDEIAKIEKRIQGLVDSIKPTWCEDIIVELDKIGEKQFYCKITYVVEDDSPTLLLKNRNYTDYLIRVQNNLIEQVTRDFLKTKLIINNSGITAKSFYERNKLNEQEEKDGLSIFIEQFNEREYETIEDFFGSLEYFIKYVQKKGRISELDERETLVLYVMKQQDPNVVYEAGLQFFSDVIKEGEDYFLVISDLSDFASCFKYYRDSLSEKLVEAILNGDYEEIYYDTTDDPYRDVVEVLNSENLEYFKKILKEKLLEIGKIEINSSVSELLSNLSDTIAIDGDITLTPNLIDELLNDEETFQYLIEEYSDLMGDLYNIHSTCYNDIVHNEIYKKLWRELTGSVIDDAEIGEYQYQWKTWDGKINTRRKYKFKITKCLFEVVDSFLNEYKNYNDNLEDIGSYLSTWIKLCDESDDSKWRLLHTPDTDIYPYSRDMDKCINDSFGNYF